MSTRKPQSLPQRKDGDTSQAGCRGFESRPPLPERDGIMPKGGGLHIGAPRLISPLGPVWVQTIEKPPLIWALGRLSSEQDRSQHVDGALLQAGQTMGVAVRA